jgi:hypothetical protein
MSDEPIHYEIVNTYGVKILSKDLSATEKVIDEVLEFSNQQNGLYHLIVTVGGKVETMILVKSN